jgi:hypothetical protein
VTVVDSNVTPPATVMNSQRLNDGSVAVQIQVQEDGNGDGGVAWTAVRCNDASISRQGNAVPSNLGQVDVSAS